MKARMAGFGPSSGEATEGDRRSRFNQGWCYAAAAVLSVALWYGVIELVLALT